ncbi:MAG: glutathione peroxidase [Coleofasciculaceae cyanobacterium SM2_1_6]|nr:glutathione peroxidase [Coleofasciculaceae cyanobacterium SM2_1_6]
MTSIQDITISKADGSPQSLADYAGKVLLLVNVASYCGYTPQYPGLEKLHQQYKDQGLVVLGLPCNDFGAQEPGTNAEIQTFCTTNYGVTFELLDKVHAKGAEQHPLYARLTETPQSEVKWNFEKFLISKQGEVVQQFRSAMSPEAPELIAAIEQELAK